MNKELYLKKEETLNKLRKISSTVGKLERFLGENEKNFKREESIQVLKKLREYLQLKKELEKELESWYKQQNIELIKMCEHEVSIKNRRTQSYRCLICGCIMDEKQAQSILVDISNDYQVEYIIEKELQNIIHSNKDLMQKMLSLIENMQYERDIKVYRR